MREDRRTSALDRLAEDFAAYKTSSENQNRDLRAHFEKLEGQMQTLIETSKIRNEEQTATRARHEDQIREAKDLTLKLDEAQARERDKLAEVVTRERERLEARVSKIEGDSREFEGALKFWKIVGGALGALFMSSLIYLFFFAWKNDRVASEPQSRTSSSRHYEDREP